nr:alanine racemase [Tatlockia sp.]
MVRQHLENLETPALILDQQKMDQNIERMKTQINRLNVSFRPHVKTSKCIEVARRIMTAPQGPIAVSTLHEADYFAALGVKDILYAVGIAPNKLDHVTALRQKGIKLSIILDNIETARLIADGVNQKKWQGFDVLIEVDSDGHRAGVPPHSPELIEIGLLLHKAGVNVEGVMTHAGESYKCNSLEEIQAMAEQERLAVVVAAERLRSRGLD